MGFRNNTGHLINVMETDTSCGDMDHSQRLLLSAKIQNLAVTNQIHCMEVFGSNLTLFSSGGGIVQAGRQREMLAPSGSVTSDI